MPYVIGLDGGGTATHANVFELSSNRQKLLSAGAININGGNCKQTSGTLAELFERIDIDFAPLSQCLYLCMGAAGVSNKASRFFLEDCIKSSGYSGPFKIVPDSETALFGAFEGHAGAILIAGTGSICLGMSADGRHHRTGGLGYLLDDGGSGYRIGQEILSSVVRSWDGRADKTLFCECLKNEGITSAEMLSAIIYGSPAVKKLIASYAKYLPSAYEQKDPVAIRIVSVIASELLELVIPVIQKLSLDNAQLALCGGVFRHHPYIRDQFVNNLASYFPNLSCAAPLHDAAYGARLMAMRAVGYI